MTHYLMLFNALWRAKRLEWLLSGVWKNLASMHKMQSRMVPELSPLLHIANLLASEMIHFIHQLAYYITFEVGQEIFYARPKEILRPFLGNGMWVGNITEANSKS